ncbi:uncharacterized [Tachysurus ichikawai]
MQNAAGCDNHWHSFQLKFRLFEEAPPPACTLYRHAFSAKVVVEKLLFPHQLPMVRVGKKNASLGQVKDRRIAEDSGIVNTACPSNIDIGEPVVDWL